MLVELVTASHYLVALAVHSSKAYLGHSFIQQIPAV